jgi:hypothetical protein
MCFVWISEQPAIISLHSINWLVCVTETVCVYCAVRTGCLCFVCISEQTEIISLYIINWLVCITETECLLRGMDWMFVCFVCISEKTAIISLYSIKWLVFRHVRKIAKKKKLLASSCPCVCPSVGIEQLGSQWSIFIKFDIRVFFQNCPENSSFNKIWHEQRVPYIQSRGHLRYFGELFLEWEMLLTKVVDKIRTHILCSATFSPENRAVYETVWKKCCTAVLATDDNMAHAHCMLGN